MIEEPGQVVRVAGDWAWVETRRGSACGHCASSAQCGTASLSRLFSRRAITLRVRNTAGVAPGDRVLLGLPEGAFLRGALAMYAVPLLGLLAGAVAVQGLLAPAGEGPVVLGGAAGLALGLAWARRWSRRHADHYQPTLLRRL